MEIGVFNMLGDIKIKNKFGKTICVGRFESVNAIIEYYAIIKKAFISCNFDNTLLCDVNFCKSRLIDCSFVDSTIYECNMEECYIHSCAFQKAKIIKTNMDMVEARKTCFNKASFAQCQISLSKIINCSFKKASFDSSTKILRSKIYESSFIEAALINVSFTGSRISDSDFNEAYLSGAYLDDCVIFNTTFHYAKMKHMSLIGSNIDHSSIMLNCHIESIKASDRLVAQLIYHVTRLDFSECSDIVQSELVDILEGPLGDMFLNYRTDLRSAEKTLQNHNWILFRKGNKTNNESDINERTVY